MNDKVDKSKISELISKAKKKGLIKKYSEFCKSKEGKQSKLSDEEVIYYTSKNKKESK